MNNKILNNLSVCISTRKGRTFKTDMGLPAYQNALTERMRDDAFKPSETCMTDFCITVESNPVQKSVVQLPDDIRLRMTKVGSTEKTGIAQNSPRTSFDGFLCSLSSLCTETIGPVAP